MALRTFQSNPSLGGFGNESTSYLLSDKKRGAVKRIDGDAFAQIIKELVDNAVDACSRDIEVVLDQEANNSTDGIFPKRVRVEIQEFQNPSGDQCTLDDEEDEILRVTVTDNGCGMNDIRSSVDPFHTSKAHGTGRSTRIDEESVTARVEPETAGRYGIGLTLCLLHAQRLVPGSCAMIRSATSTQRCWTTMKCFVDTENDAIDCMACTSLSKSYPEECGTSVSLLVPGGSSAAAAWPRVAEYFARFKLCLGMQCSLEVLAPTLSRVPLSIQPLYLPGDQGCIDDDEDKVGKTRDVVDKSWVNGITNKFFNVEGEQGAAPNPAKPGSYYTTPKVVAPTKGENERHALWQVALHYLGRSFDRNHVAHAVVPIRNASDDRSSRNQPKLEVSIVVHGPEDDDTGDGTSNGHGDLNYERGGATMVLVRMVNKVPLLDSSEAAACGLVKSIAAKKRMWNAFGLHVVRQENDSNPAKLLTFEVRDSDQVAPFFHRGNHARLAKGEIAETSRVIVESLTDGEDRGFTRETICTKRHRCETPSQLLPASIRLGNILLILQIHARPSNLPLPSLSKGRLPTENVAIDNAVEVGITACLRQLQSINPDLLLAASELRNAERDAQYIPAIAASLASIAVHSKENLQVELKKNIEWPTDWKNSSKSKKRGVCDFDYVERYIEERLRGVTSRLVSRSRSGVAKSSGDRDLRNEKTCPDRKLPDHDSFAEIGSLASPDRATVTLAAKSNLSFTACSNLDFQDW